MKVWPIYLILAILSLLLAKKVNSDDTNNDLFKKKQIDDNTIQELKDIAKIFSDTTLVRTKFIQTKLIKGLKKPLVSEGNFLFAQNKGLFFETLKPFEQLTVLTPKNLIQKDSAGIVSVITSDAHPALKNSVTTFLSVFSGESEILLKQFQVYCEISQNNWQIGLIPKDKSSGNEFIVRITFSGDKFLKTINIDEKEGNTTTIQFMDHQTTPLELSKNEQNYFEQK